MNIRGGIEGDAAGTTPKAPIEKAANTKPEPNTRKLVPGTYTAANFALTYIQYHTSAELKSMIAW